MTDLHGLLADAADRLPQRATPPFENVLARARRRRTMLTASSATTAALAITAAAIVPIALGHHHGAQQPAGIAGSPSLLSSPPAVSGGQCVGLDIVADLPGNHRGIQNLPTMNAFTVRVGQTITFTATGPCHADVRIQPSQPAPAVLGSVAGVPSATENVAAFSALTPGVERLDVVLETPCDTGGPCVASLPTIGDITVTVTAG
jgi:hypothetical protein